MESTERIESLATQINQLSGDEKRKLLQLAPDLANSINDEIVDAETLKKARKVERARIRKKRAEGNGSLFAKPTYTFEKIKKIGCPIKYVDGRKDDKIATFIDERLYHVPKRFGEYLCSYLSDNEEVLIDFFKKPVGQQKDTMEEYIGVVAYIRFQLTYEEVKDNWPYPMEAIARAYGFPGVSIEHFDSSYWL